MTSSKSHVGFGPGDKFFTVSKRMNIFLKIVLGSCGMSLIGGTGLACLSSIYEEAQCSAHNIHAPEPPALWRHKLKVTIPYMWNHPGLSSQGYTNVSVHQLSMRFAFGLLSEDSSPRLDVTG